MKKNVFFEMFGVRYDLTLDTNEIDRNYNDETYAYWVVERNGKYFEVNIWKDDNGNFTDSGKVYGFSDYDNFVNAGDADEEVDVKFTDEIRSLIGKSNDVCPHCGSQNFEWFGDAVGEDNETPYHCYDCDKWFNIKN